MRKDKNLAARRTRRNRYHIRKAGKGKPRLSVYRSGQNIYAQVIRDDESRTVAAASTLDKELSGKLKTGANVDAAKAVGELIAKRAQDAGVTEVVFDRGGYLYHGRVRALAEAAREGGLSF